MPEPSKKSPGERPAATADDVVQFNGDGAKPSFANGGLTMDKQTTERIRDRVWHSVNPYTAAVAGL